MYIVWLLNKFKSNMRDGFQAFIPLLILAFYTVIGAVLFMYLEGPNETYEMEKLKEEREKLLENTAFRLNNLRGLSPIQAYNHTIKTLLRFQDKLGVEQVVPEVQQHWTIWGAIFYCMTVYTTIGYGNIVPVTTAGRIFTILYAFIGIPLTVMVLYALGQQFAKLCHLIWKAMLKSTSVVSKDLEKKVSRMGEAPTSAQLANGDNDLLSFPIWFLLLIAVIWVLLCAAIFLIWEQDWNYGTSLYFTLISFTTIGFGDVLPSEYDYMILVGILLIMGLSLISTVMSIIQQQIEALAMNMQENIDKEYMEALAEARDEGEVDESEAAAALKAKTDNADPESQKSATNTKTLDSVVSRMPLKSRLLYHIMPAGSKKQLEKKNESVQSKRTRSSQTDDSLLQSVLEEAELKACLASPPVISATVSPAVSSPPSPQKAEITVTVNESVSPEEEEEEEDEEEA